MLPAAFVLHLPPHKRAALEQVRKMKTVLLVDDDPATIEAWTLSMQGEDCNVLCAFDGNKALSILGEQSVDIVVSDWMMPGLGGALLCQTMKNDASLAHIPFLMISGHPNPPAFVSYDGYLRKPVDVGTLIAAVNRLCAAKKRPPY
ncbi:response regulator receiver protein [Burkholderia sp. SJ98]|jgi:CheY-like chemotaxis protein|nr:response regulator receiver protein [Burkholderia sp. SJ98]MCI1042367.1 response regulator [Caballeronia zhejiangensis]